MKRNKSVGLLLMLVLVGLFFSGRVHGDGGVDFHPFPLYVAGPDKLEGTWVAQTSAGPVFIEIKKDKDFSSRPILDDWGHPQMKVEVKVQGQVPLRGRLYTTYTGGVYNRKKVLVAELEGKQFPFIVRVLDNNDLSFQYANFGTNRSLCGQEIQIYSFVMKRSHCWN